jgi:hypothetical protein
VARRRDPAEVRSGRHGWAVTAIKPLLRTAAFILAVGQVLPER